MISLEMCLYVLSCLLVGHVRRKGFQKQGLHAIPGGMVGYGYSRLSRCSRSLSPVPACPSKTSSADGQQNILLLFFLRKIYYY